MSEANQTHQGGTRIQGISKKGNTNLPLVSIITVVFNGELELETTIKSVIEQSYKNIEYIIIDGASSDKTLDIIHQYESEIDYWCSESDNGIYDAMNKGIKATQGQIIGLINCGDSYMKNTIAEIVHIYYQYIRENPFLVITGAMFRFDREKNYQFKIEKSQKLLDTKINRGMPINHPATFITKATYDKLGLYNSQYRICGDYDLIFRLYHNCLVQFIFTEQIIAQMQLGGISEKFSSIWLRCREHFQIRKNYLSLLHNLWLCCSFYLISTIKFTLKQIVSNSMMSLYYRLRH